MWRADLECNSWEWVAHMVSSLQFKCCEDGTKRLKCEPNQEAMSDGRRRCGPVFRRVRPDNCIRAVLPIKKKLHVRQQLVTDVMSRWIRHPTRRGDFQGSRLVRVMLGMHLEHQFARFRVAPRASRGYRLPILCWECHETCGTLARHAAEASR